VKFNDDYREVRAEVQARANETGFDHGVGAALAGWPIVVGIEQDAEYIHIARARLAHWLKEGST
jgi:hypothetical protein